MDDMTASEKVLLRMLGQAGDANAMAAILQCYIQDCGFLGEEAADLARHLMAKRMRKWATARR